MKFDLLIVPCPVSYIELSMQTQYIQKVEKQLMEHSCLLI